ncbi:Base plate wedge protein 53 [Mesorhizobium sp. BR1-1-16]|uniref:Base plate wedge protein 53 n=1 Tax=Mesorhizobium sp. BR1-1-16 TaxID=2876653 RepID=UPI001CCBA7C6|nr:Base plate wedge protein 53 [Mesorhizobium sp. BR1-1-16]MBZ9935662.1 Base plate wedge protein 53 [Mesorhizobium sp. BR1-1-16]
MSVDPIQALIDAGAIPSETFGPDSRYAGVPLALYRRHPDDEGVPFVRRRFIPQRREVTAMVEHTVRSGDRPDLLAAMAFGNPELYWRIADANAVTDPLELTDELGEHVIIPNPPGF